MQWVNIESLEIVSRISQAYTLESKLSLVGECVIEMQAAVLTKPKAGPRVQKEKL